MPHYRGERGGGGVSRGFGWHRRQRQRRQVPRRRCQVSAGGGEGGAAVVAVVARMKRCTYVGAGADAGARAGLGACAGGACEYRHVHVGVWEQR